MSISTLSIQPALFAQSVIALTALNSPSETLADATSILSTFKSSNNNFAMVNFSEEGNETPDVCSPSRSVVSIISIFLLTILKWSF